MSVKTVQHRIRNTIFREKVVAVPIVEKMVVLRWAGHVWMRHGEAFVRTINRIENSLVAGDLAVD